jgi:hypothetical protein
MIEGLVKLLTASCVLLLFGYVQHQYEMGYVVTFMLSLYLFKKGSYIALLLGFVQIGFLYYKLLCPNYVVFLLLEGVFLVLLPNKDDDLTIKMKPYEKEIRQFLLEHDPSVLHEVDSWLSKFEGKEDEYYELLLNKYSNDDNDSNDDDRYISNNYIKNKSERYLSTREEIYRLVRDHRPDLQSNMTELLDHYKGKEIDLLKTLRAQYSNKTLKKPSKQTIISSNYNDLIDNAKFNANTAIKKRIRAAQNRK